MTSVAPTTRALPTDAAADEHRQQLRRRLRSSIITLAISLTFLMAFPIAAWSVEARQNTQQIDSLIQVALYLGGLSLLPFAVMTLTSFLRIVVVLSFLRSGLGAQNVPPNIVIIALALFLSLFVMGPTIDQINKDALQPLLKGEFSTDEAFAKAKDPLKGFMIAQLAGKSSAKEIRTFHALAVKQSTAKCTEADFDPNPRATTLLRLERDPYTGKLEKPNDCLITLEQFDDRVGDVKAAKLVDALPLRVIIPAFIVSELKKAFIMGFAVLLPFLVIDMVISNILLSLGMFMLPPVVISLPFKILLFVLAGGWTMVVEFIVMGFNYT